jgi:hypothetical protein
MNYRYWKERSQAEMTDDGVRARQNFYEGTLAYRTRTSTRGAEVQGRPDDLGRPDEELPRLSNDDLNRKDTGIILRRYLRVLGQQSAQATGRAGDLPFKELLEGPAPDDSPDPFDASEMLSAAAIENLTQGPGHPPSPAPSRRK